MPDFVIREATEADGPAIAALLADAFAPYGDVGFAPAVWPQPDRAPGEVAARGGRMWVATQDGSLAGSLALLPTGRQGEFELAMICLGEAARGRGLAAAMLVGADAFAAASGGDRLAVWVDDRLVEGARFLERQGFVRDPGVKARHEGSNALEGRYARDVGAGLSAELGSDASADDGSGNAA